MYHSEKNDCNIMLGLKGVMGLLNTLPPQQLPFLYIYSTLKHPCI